MSPQEKYDVFLSFRGEDTRDGFTSHLYAALCRKKLMTYIDYNLEKGHQISKELLKAIEESTVALVVFSEHYASSTWCLDELVHILKFQKTIIPIFYNIDPSHVRHQKFTFEEAFSKHDERFKDQMDKVNAWRAALKEAANLSGFHSEQIRPESKLVEKIIEHVLKKLKQELPTSFEFQGLVGLDKHIKEVESLLCIYSLDIRVLGLWGMGGIGKTTLAGAIFHRLLSQFEGCCFIANIREESEKHGSLNHLRNKLLLEILDEGKFDMGTPFLESSFVRKQLQRKRVLIVFDDVSDSRQLEFLVGDQGQFGPGSRIIVTTRDVQVLRNGVDVIYKVGELSSKDAFQLFLSHAFRRIPLTKNYEELMGKVLHYAKGVPLAIKVLGSFLHCRSKEEWQSVLNKLGKYPKLEIHNVLRISYDGLEDEEKEIFLDIACFFTGYKRNNVENIFDGRGFSATIGLRVLADRCLIAIEHDSKLHMHDLIKEMGQNIVRKESLEPGRRSRLWSPEDVYHVFKNNTGSEALEGIIVNTSIMKPVRLGPAIFSKMYNLRYLHWNGFPLKSLPSDFLPETLVELKLPGSQLELFLDEDKVSNMECSNFFVAEDYPSPIGFPENLVSLDLSYSKGLKNLPKNVVSVMKSLLYLDLSRCSSLDQFPELLMNVETLDLSETAIEVIPSSIKYCSFLKYFYLRNCKKLRTLPTSICKVERLECLNLYGCSKLEKLPEILEPMKNLCSLDLSHSAIRRLPSSIENLTGLEMLSMNDCRNLEDVSSSIFNLKHLRFFIYSSNTRELQLLPISLELLWMNSCRISQIPFIIGCLSFLRFINLDRSTIESLPAFNLLSNLSTLSLRYCERLRALPELPQSLMMVSAHHCTLLETVPSSRKGTTPDWDLYLLPAGTMVMFEFSNCPNLDHSSRGNIIDDTELYFTILQLVTISTNQHVGETTVHCCMPGNEIPDRFHYHGEGSSIHIKLLPDWNTSNFLGFALCAVASAFHSPGDYLLDIEYNLDFKDSSGETLLEVHKQPVVRRDMITGLSTDHVYLFYDNTPIPATSDIDTISLSFHFRFAWHLSPPWGLDHDVCNVNKCGISLLYARIFEAED